MKDLYTDSYQIYMCIHIHADTDSQFYVYMYVCMYSPFVCMDVCVYVCVYVYSHDVRISIVQIEAGLELYAG